MTYKLICFDMDGVFFKDINFWMKVHEVFGTLEEGKELTKKYLHTDYARLVEEVVVKLWKGKDAKPYFDLVNAMEYLPGVPEVMKHVSQNGWITAIMSASSIDVARRVQHDYGIDHLFANELVIRDGKVYGEFVWPIGQGKQEKAKILRHLCEDLNIFPKECIYIGDSENDSLAFQEVGLAIAFNPTADALRAYAHHTVEDESLAAVLEYLPSK